MMPKYKFDFAYNQEHEIQTVFLKVEIACGKYCFLYNQSDQSICPQFHNENAVSECALHFFGQEDTEKGTLKSLDCLIEFPEPNHD